MKTKQNNIVYDITSSPMIKQNNIVYKVDTAYKKVGGINYKIFDYAAAGPQEPVNPDMGTVYPPATFPTWLPYSSIYDEDLNIGPFGYDNYKSDHILFHKGMTWQDVHNNWNKVFNIDYEEEGGNIFDLFIEDNGYIKVLSYIDETGITIYSNIEIQNYTWYDKEEGVAHEVNCAGTGKLCKLTDLIMPYTQYGIE